MDILDCRIVWVFEMKRGAKLLRFKHIPKEKTNGVTSVPSLVMNTSRHTIIKTKSLFVSSE